MASDLKLHRPGGACRRKPPLYVDVAKAEDFDVAAGEKAA